MVRAHSQSALPAIRRWLAESERRPQTPSTPGDPPIGQGGTEGEFSQGWATSQAVRSASANLQGINAEFPAENHPELSSDVDTLPL